MEQTPPGWYPHPDGGVRWWNGQQWADPPSVIPPTPVATAPQDGPTAQVEPTAWTPSTPPPQHEGGRPFPKDRGRGRTIALVIGGLVAASFIASEVEAFREDAAPVSQTQATEEVAPATTAPMLAAPTLPAKVRPAVVPAPTKEAAEVQAPAPVEPPAEEPAPPAPAKKLPAAPPAPAAPAPAAPQGTLELTKWQNAIPYSDECAHVVLYFANRSDTAVRTATLRFHGENAAEQRIDLGWRELPLGLAPFASQTYDLRVCDPRMAGRKYGPAAIPDELRWEWF